MTNACWGIPLTETSFLDEVFEKERLTEILQLSVITSYIQITR